MKTYQWDPAEDIQTREDVVCILQAAIEEHDPAFLLSVIGDVARSKGMAQIARELNLSREGLYDALSEKGNPSFITMLRVLDNLGFQLDIRQKKAS